MIKEYSDDELIALIRQDHKNIEIVYRDCKIYCISTMKKNCKSNIFYDDIEWLDIYHYAIYEFLAKYIIKPDFSVKGASIKTFLTTICINQFKVRIKRKSREISLNTDDVFHKNSTPSFSLSDFEMNNGKIPTIKKSHITEMDDSSEDNETKESMLKVLLIEYKKLKDLDTKCYDILNRFFFKKQSQDIIAFEMNYANADTIKNLKSRCQKNLREMVKHVYKN
jgi:hypothetical protein